MLIRSLRLDGFLSFAPGSEPFEMRPLNVLIGPNGAGKSNLIDALELRAAAPEDQAHPLKRRDGLRERLWKGEPETREAEIEVVLGPTASLLFGLSTEPDTVVTCERPGDRTVLERLDPEKLAFWLDDYTLGDVWLMGGLEANP